MSLGIISGIKNEIKIRQASIASLVRDLDARDYITFAAEEVSTDAYQMRVLEVPGTDGQVALLKWGSKSELLGALPVWVTKTTEQSRGIANKDLLVTWNGLERAYSFVRSNDKEVRESSVIGQAIHDFCVAKGVKVVFLPNADEAVPADEFEVREATGKFLSFANTTGTARFRSNRGC